MTIFITISGSIILIFTVLLLKNLNKEVNINRNIRILNCAEQNELIKYNDYIYNNYKIFVSKDISRHSYIKSINEMSIKGGLLLKFEKSRNIANYNVLRENIIRISKDEVGIDVINGIYLKIKDFLGYKKQSEKYNNQNTINLYKSKIGEIEKQIEIEIKRINQKSSGYMKSIKKVMNKIKEINNIKTECNKLDQSSINISKIDQLELKLKNGLEQYVKSGIKITYEFKIEKIVYDENYIIHDSRDSAKANLKEQNLNESIENIKVINMNSPWKQKNYRTKIIENIMISEYVQRHFNSRLYKKYENRYLKYEMEYIAAGKNTDKSNLESIVRKIKIILFVIEAPKIYKNKILNAKAYKTALAICGISGLGPSCVLPVKNLLILSYINNKIAEDIKILKTGKKVSAMGNLKLGYEEFVKILIVCESEKNIIERIANCINMSVEKNNNGILLEYYQGFISEVKIGNKKYIRNVRYEK